MWGSGNGELNSVVMVVVRSKEQYRKELHWNQVLTGASRP